MITSPLEDATLLGITSALKAYKLVCVCRQLVEMYNKPIDVS